MQNSLFGKSFQIPWPQSRLGDPRGCFAGLCPCWNSLEKCWIKAMEEGFQSWECWALASTVPKGSKSSKRFQKVPRAAASLQLSLWEPGLFSRRVWVGIPGQCNVLTVQIQGCLQHCPVCAPCAGATHEGFVQMVPLQAATQNPSLAEFPTIPGEQVLMVRTTPSGRAAADPWPSSKHNLFHP